MKQNSEKDTLNKFYNAYYIYNIFQNSIFLSDFFSIGLSLIFKHFLFINNFLQVL